MGILFTIGTAFAKGGGFFNLVILGDRGAKIARWFRLQVLALPERTTFPNQL